MSPKSSVFGLAALFCVLLSSCASARQSKAKPEEWTLSPVPEGVFMGKPERAYQGVGTVRTWQAFPTSLDDSFGEVEFQRRCQKAFYEAAGKLLSIARENGAESVVQVSSVVFLADGRKEYHPKPECAEDGEEGEALVEGLAIRWTEPAPSDSGALTGKPKKRPQDRPRQAGPKT